MKYCLLSFYACSEAKPMLTEGTQAMTDSSVRMQSVFQQAINAISELHIFLLDALFYYKLCILYVSTVTLSIDRGIAKPHSQALCVCRLQYEIRAEGLGSFIP